MKQLLTILMAVVAAFTATAQTKELVTLSHDGQLTFFDNSMALEDAIAAAQEGDIIYLSEGKFGVSSTNIEIQDKNILIAGSGYKSHIVANLYYKFDNVTARESAILFDGVRLHFIHFGANDNIDNLIVQNCCIDDISSGGSRVYLYRCYIKNFGGGEEGTHIVNSKIESYSGTGHVLDNCHINKLDWDRSRFLNCVIGYMVETEHLGMYENCLMGRTSAYEKPSSDRMENCYTIDAAVLDEDLECTITDMSEYVGTDGTVIGIYGGQSLPYSKYPTLPSVDSANSSIEHDKDGNKLNVSITVTPN